MGADGNSVAPDADAGGNNHGFGVSGIWMIRLGGMMLVVVAEGLGNDLR